MDVRRAPRIVVISPRVTAWLYRHEPITAVLIRQRVATTCKARIQRSIVLIAGMQVPPGSVRLPEFYQRVRDGSRIFIEYAAAHDDPLSQRLSFMLAGEIYDGRGNVLRRKLRTRHFRKRVRNDHQGLAG